MKKLFLLPLAAIALAACSDDHAGMMVTDPGAAGEIVVTPGVPAPAPVQKPGGPSFSKLENARASLGGSTTTPLAINGGACSEFPARTVTISYTVSGNQSSPARFDVYTKWDFDGSKFVGSSPTTVNLPAKQGGGDATYQVQISVENSAHSGTGATSFKVTPFNVHTNASDSPGQQLAIDATSTATVYVAFTACTPVPENTRPSLTIPTDRTEEATSSAGAQVSFVVSATDNEDGDLTQAVKCVPASGSTFAIGATEVTCSVKDSGGLEAQGSFWVYVQDTTAPVFTSIPSGTIQRVATNINGWVLDQASFGITTEDRGPGDEPGDVSGPVTVVCTAQGPLTIGSTVQVDCIASDAASYRAPGVDVTAPNNRAESFKVQVTLDLSGVTGFQSPLRMIAPFSAHKLNSAIPHKFPAPKYADGTRATDLANGLNLTLRKLDNTPGTSPLDVTDAGAGSTAWRYETDSGQYTFNLKTSTKAPWSQGRWQTIVSYAGITLATTELDLHQ